MVLNLWVRPMVVFGLNSPKAPKKDAAGAKRRTQRLYEHHPAKNRGRRCEMTENLRTLNVSFFCSARLFRSV